jgi:hypothetical protein
MFLIHPVFQSVGILITLYVMKLGISRFRMVHLKQKIRFNWKQHVRFGIIATSIFMIGICGGLYTVKTGWHAMLITGYHAKVGLLLIPFILFAIGSGFYMDKNKNKRKALPLIHAICNIVMLFLALSQIYTGIGVYRTYVLGL